MVSWVLSCVAGSGPQQSTFSISAQYLNLADVLRYETSLRVCLRVPLEAVKMFRHSTVHTRPSTIRKFQYFKRANFLQVEGLIGAVSGIITH